MPKSLWKRKRGLQHYLGAVEPLPCVLKINHTLNFPEAPSAIPHLRYPEVASPVPRAQPASSSQQQPASRKLCSTRHHRSQGRASVRSRPGFPRHRQCQGRVEHDGEKKGPVPPLAHLCKGRVRGAAHPARHGAHHPCDALFRSCLAFPENTNFIIDLCSFVIFITWPALLLKAVTNPTSPGWKG